MEYLLKKRNHPTVDEIYKELIKEIPTLSKTTVYNALNLFVDTNMVQVITIEENEARYDADTETHGHFKCSKCGRIWDFRIGVDLTTPEELSGFVIEEKNVYFRGICDKCL